MSVEEALEWMSGRRSLCNMMYGLHPDGNRLEEEAAIVRADTAMMERAYWVLKAHGALPLNPSEVTP